VRLHPRIPDARYRTRWLLPRAEHGKIHGVDERIPVDRIEEMTEIVYALVERWNEGR
jgi:acetylornithine deacetylase/succinyl-diaminopimelate desuccinylase-like protein